MANLWDAPSLVERRCKKDEPGPGHRWALSRTGKQLETITRTCTDCGRVETFVPDGNGGIVDRQVFENKTLRPPQSMRDTGSFANSVIGSCRAHGVVYGFDRAQDSSNKWGAAAMTLATLPDVSIKEYQEAILRSAAARVGLSFGTPGIAFNAIEVTNATQNSPEQQDAAGAQPARLPYDPQNVRQIELDD